MLELVWVTKKLQAKKIMIVQPLVLPLCNIFCANNNILFTLLFSHDRQAATVLLTPLSLSSWNMY